MSRACLVCEVLILAADRLVGPLEEQRADDDHQQRLHHQVALQAGKAMTSSGDMQQRHYNIQQRSSDTFASKSL